MTYDPSGDRSREGTRDDAPGGFRVVRVPADVNRPDTLLAGLTARQLLILAAVAAVLYAAWAATRTVVPPLSAVAVAVPVAGAAFAAVTVRRDGIGVDQWAVAAARFRRSPRRLVPRPGRAVPAWAAAPPQPPVAPLRVPAAGINTNSTDTGGVDGAEASDGIEATGGVGAAGGAGVLDLGSDGAAVVCAATTVNLGLRTPAEQDALVAGYGGWLNSLTGPVQVIIRADRIDLGPLITELQDHAAELPDPALEAAALAHAEFLADLAAGRDLLRRQALLVLREPLPPWTGNRADPEGGGGIGGRGRRRAASARAQQRAAETAAALAPLGIRVTVLDAASAAAVLATAADPDRPPAPTGLSAPGAAVTGRPGGHPSHPAASDDHSWR